MAGKQTRDLGSWKIRKQMQKQILNVNKLGFDHSLIWHVKFDYFSLFKFCRNGRWVAEFEWQVDTNNVFDQELHAEVWRKVQCMKVFIFLDISW